ncbi:MAG TPA: glycerate kinase [Polyangiaceae bacterium]|nr:glycerate kinase [Polyangiaceae bacterium]
MNILVAPNALKGSLGPIEAAGAIAEGLAQGYPDARLDELPIADGGDATAAVLVRALGGTFAEATAQDPLGRSRKASFGIFGDGNEAVIEVAQSSGLALLAPMEQNPLAASSYGAGQLVLAALERGCRRIDIALGGSATVDGGAGLVEALGVRLLDGNGDVVARGGGGLLQLEHIDVAGLDSRVAKADIVALCDVDNALLGDAGAARAFGPQKGATPEGVERLEANLAHFADIIERDLRRDVRHLRHGGAAGGIGAAVAGILGGHLAPGADFVLERLNVRERLAGKDVVVTAEGQLDRQTLQNKAPWALARAARAMGIPVIVLAGGIAEEVEVDREAFHLFDIMVPACPRPMALAEAMRTAREQLVASARRVGQLLRLGGAVAVARRVP